MAQKWEYLFATLDRNQKKEWVIKVGGQEYPNAERSVLFDNLGEKGWELVSTYGWITSDHTVFTQYATTHTSDMTFIFKRPKP
jgi:hypothetical protein